MYSRYDYKSGFGFFYRMLEAGHYNDQVGAMFAAVIPDIDIQGVDITADQDRYNIPYYLVFRDEFQSTFSSLWANDEDKIRPTAYKTVDARQPGRGQRRHRLAHLCPRHRLLHRVQLPPRAAELHRRPAARTATTAGCPTSAPRRRTSS